jgi:hypothetical protein
MHKKQEVRQGRVEVVDGGCGHAERPILAFRHVIIRIKRFGGSVSVEFGNS